MEQRGTPMSDDTTVGSGPAAQQGGDSKRQGLLASNDLVYVLPPDLSVSVNRTHKNQYFQSTEYTNNQRAVCLLNTGADYGDMRHSSLDFTLVLPTIAGSGAWFGRHGSALNLIKNITISSRSGDELCRIQDLNLLSYHQNGYRYDKNWHDTVGQTIGMGTYMTNDSSQRFSIPLYLLGDFFGYSRLMPPMVLSGLRIEIEWAAPAEAFCTYRTAAGGRVTAAIAADHIKSYTIKDTFFSIRSVQLTDATQRALNEMSAVSGLELVYCDYERTDREESNNRLHLEIRKAASRALQACLIVRDGADAADPAVDSLRSEQFEVNRWQWQLGSLYFPQQPVSTDSTTSTAGILPESYKHALIAYEKYDSKGKSACTPLYTYEQTLNSKKLITEAGTVDNTDRYTTIPYTRPSSTTGTKGAAHGDLILPVFTPEAPIDNKGIGERYDTEAGKTTALYDYGTFANGNGIIATTLERSELFNLSGVPINNSRVLAVRCDFIPALDGAGNAIPNKKRICTTYLKYVRLARVFMNNVEVEQ